uniref:Uncharacterized protein n=1 Tax=Arundo donax TaxID=35708 RepID=A0A0A9EYD5_ARUDO
MRYVDAMVEYCAATTHDCTHEQLDLAVQEKELKLAQKVEELEEKLHQAQEVEDKLVKRLKSLKKFRSRFLRSVCISFSDNIRAQCVLIDHQFHGVSLTGFMYLA